MRHGDKGHGTLEHYAARVSEVGGGGVFGPYVVPPSVGYKKPHVKPLCRHSGGGEPATRLPPTPSPLCLTL